MNLTTSEASVELPGSMVINGFIQNLLQGIIFCQVVHYWAAYTDDSKWKRLYVASFVFVSILQTILQDYKVWRVSISHKEWSTSVLQWSDIFLNGVLCSLCEAFFIRRCWKITDKKRWVLFPLSLLWISIFIATVYLAISVQLTTRALSPGDAASRAGRYLLPSTIVAYTYWIFGSLVLDTSVTSILLFYLWRSRTGFLQSDRAIWHIISITWESALPPAISMLASVSLYHSSPRKRDHLVLFFIILTGKLYVLGLLRTLNSRTRLRERMKSHDLGRTSLSNWNWEQAGTSNDSMSELPRTGQSVSAVSPVSTTIPPTSIMDESNSGPSVAFRIGEVTRDVQFSSPSMDARERGFSKSSRLSSH